MERQLSNSGLLVESEYVLQGAQQLSLLETALGILMVVEAYHANRNAQQTRGAQSKGSKLQRFRDTNHVDWRYLVSIWRHEIASNGHSVTGCHHPSGWFHLVPMVYRAIQRFRAFQPVNN